MLVAPGGWAAARRRYRATDRLAAATDRLAAVRWQHWGGESVNGWRVGGASRVNAVVAGACPVMGVGCLQSPLAGFRGWRWKKEISDADIVEPGFRFVLAM